MVDNKKVVGKSFDEMFGDAQEFVPNPTDIVESDFATLDEEEGSGEEELVDIDCTGITPADDVIESDEEEEEVYDEEDLENLGLADENEASKGLSDDTALVGKESTTTPL